MSGVIFNSYALDLFCIGYLTVADFWQVAAVRGSKRHDSTRTDRVIGPAPRIGLHGLDQALRTQIGPVLLDVGQARRAVVLAEHLRPTCRDPANVSHSECWFSSLTST